MAIYTVLSVTELASAAEAFGLGEVLSATPIPQGSINTNVRLETERGRFFLRHTTVRSTEDLVFEAELLDHLAAKRFPSPQMLKTLEEQPCFSLAGGRVCIFGFLPGEERTRAQLDPISVERLGARLGQLHRATDSFSGERHNPYGPATVEGWLTGLQQEKNAVARAAAEELSGYLLQALPLAQGLPAGVIHADLFLDNVKWVGDQVGALFDFEMACRDTYLLDLAITLNAWCFDQSYRADLCQALLRGYQSERPLLPEEEDAVHGALLFGAVRYATSRIRDFHLSPLGPELLAPKDFRTYLARARALSAMGAEGLRDLLGTSFRSRRGSSTGRPPA